MAGANIIDTVPFPCTPWPLPTWPFTGSSRPKRLFFTPPNLTRFQANWAACGTITAGAPGPGPFPFPDTLNLGVFWQSTDPNNVALVNALHYLATGNTSYIATAVSNALAAPYAITGSTFIFGAFAAPFVLDWCYDQLTGTQISNLIALIDNYCGQWYTNLSTTSNGNWSPHEGFRQPQLSFLTGQIAIQGETGATDRNLKLRNLAQNIITTLDENVGDGLYPYYPYQDGFNELYAVIWEIATGQQVKCQYNINRAESQIRALCGDGSGWRPVMSGDQTTNTDGTVPGGGSGSAQPSLGYKTIGPAWNASMCAITAHGNTGSWKWLEGQCLAGGVQRNMTNAWVSSPMWIGLIFYDSTITPVAPQSAGFTLNKALLGERVVNFRSSWTAMNSTNTDVQVWFNSPPQLAHFTIGSGSVEVFRGNDVLLKKGTTYITLGGASHSWYTDEWSDIGYSKNIMSFSPSGKTNPDTLGSQRVFGDKSTQWSESNGARWFPYSARFVAQIATFRLGEITHVDFPNGGNGSYGMAYSQLSEAYYSISQAVNNQYVTAYKRKVCCIPGTQGKMTIIIRDQFTNSSAINLIKWGFFSPNQPTVVSQFSPTQVAGGPTLGVIQYN
jgi:hypothetical protein